MKLPGDPGKPQVTVYVFPVPPVPASLEKGGILDSYHSGASDTLP